MNVCGGQGDRERDGDGDGDWDGFGNGIWRRGYGEAGGEVLK